MICNFLFDGINLELKKINLDVIRNLNQLKVIRNLIKKYKLDYIKIPSGEITNYPFLNQISKLKKKILLSTGMATLDEIKQAIKALRKKKKNTLLFCTVLLTIQQI